MISNKLSDEIVREYHRKFPVNKFVPGESGVPVSGKVFDQDEMLRMSEAVLEGWWTEGEVTKEFEATLAKFLGVKFATTVNSGSSANLIAFAALSSHLLGKRKINKGDEVITVAAGFPTTINPIIQLGCIPVFVDVDLQTFSIDIKAVKGAITDKTKAIMVAHTLGNPINISEIKKICKTYGLWYIEDNCDAFGSKYNKKRTGSFGDISTVSFYPAHQITCGEGGALFTNNALLNKIIRSIRDWGRDCWCPTGRDNTCGIRYEWKLGDLPRGYDHKYTYSHLGYNLKMTEVQAACGLAQMNKLKRFIRIRKRNFKILQSELSKYNKYFYLPKPELNADPCWFGFAITVKENSPFTRNELINFLNKKKIATRLLFGGNIIKQPYFKSNNFEFKVGGPLSNTDLIMNSTFWIGVFPGITEEMLSYVVKTFSQFLDTYD